MRDRRGITPKAYPRPPLKAQALLNPKGPQARQPGAHQDAGGPAEQAADAGVEQVPANVGIHRAERVVHEVHVRSCACACEDTQMHFMGFRV